MFDNTNRRKYPRANYPCPLTLWVGNDSQETILANASNIGAGGLSVHLNQWVKVGTKLDIQLHFADTVIPFRCRGVGVHASQESKKFYTLGVQFEPLGDFQTAFLEKKIAGFIAFEQKGKN